MVLIVVVIGIIAIWVIVGLIQAVNDLNVRVNRLKQER